MRILFIGTSELGVPSLRALAASGEHTLRVFTKPDRPAGRGRRLLCPPVKEAARALGIPVEQPPDVNHPSVIETVRGLAPDVVVTASFWARLSEELLAVPRHGGLNIHPSLLPRFRGAAPIQHALLAGDPVTGVTVFRMTGRMDAGPILGRVEVPVSPEDDYRSLHDKLAEAAAPLLLDVLRGLEEGTLAPEPQDEAAAVPAPKLKKEDGAVPWERPAVEIERFLRAFTPWPGAYTFCPVRGKRIRLILTRGRVAEGAAPGEGDGGGGLPAASPPGTVLEGRARLRVACGEGVLEVLRLKREGGKELSAEAFLRGLPLEPGTLLLSRPGA